VSAEHDDGTTTGRSEGGHDSSLADHEASDESDAAAGYRHAPDGSLRGDEGTGPGVLHPSAIDREFDWRGWTLVAVMLVAFVIAPVTIYLVPPSAEAYFTVLIVFPLLPALLLAVVAVWATTRP